MQPNQDSPIELSINILRQIIGNPETKIALTVVNTPVLEMLIADKWITASLSDGDSAYRDVNLTSDGKAALMDFISHKEKDENSSQSTESRFHERIFHNETIELDGKAYTFCDFTNVIAVFRGKAGFEISDCKGELPIIQFADSAAFTVRVLRDLKSLGFEDFVRKVVDEIQG